MHLYYRRLRGIMPLFVRRMLAVLLTGLLVTEAYPAGTLQPVAPDSPPRDFNLGDLRGNPHSLTDYRGKVVAVNFWASWCPPCIKELPGMQRLQESMDTGSFAMLPVNVGEKKYRVWKFVKLINFTVPVLLDPESRTFSAWDVSVLPTSFLLDRQGRVRYRVQGDLEWDSKEVVSIIEELIHEKPEDPP